MGWLLLPLTFVLGLALGAADLAKRKVSLGQPNPDLLPVGNKAPLSGSDQNSSNGVKHA
jgi:hypothetical protein